jgi:histone H3/H4
MKGLNPVNRQSAANASEAVIEEYSDVVENYFKAITTKKEKSANGK